MTLESGAARNAFIWGSSAGSLLVSSALLGEEIQLRASPHTDPLLRRKWAEGLLHGALTELRAQCDSAQIRNVEGIIRQVMEDGPDGNDQPLTRDEIVHEARYGKGDE